MPRSVKADVSGNRKGNASVVELRQEHVTYTGIELWLPIRKSLCSTKCGLNVVQRKDLPGTELSHDTGVWQTSRIQIEPKNYSNTTNK